MNTEFFGVWQSLKQLFNMDKTGWIVVLHNDILVYTKSYCTDPSEDVAEIKRMYALKGRAERRAALGLDPSVVVLNVHKRGKTKVITEIF